MRKFIITLLLIVTSLCMAMASFGCDMLQPDKGDTPPVTEPGDGPGVTPSPSSQVTEAQFDYATDFANYPDYKFVLEGLDVVYDDNYNVIGTREIEGLILVNDNKAYLSSDYEMYLEFTGDGYCYYYMSAGDGWIRMQLPENEACTFIEPFLEQDFDFSDFTYDSANGVYIYENADTDEKHTLTFSDGKLVKFREDYRESGYDVYGVSEVYYNVGSTITLPTNFVDLGENPGPGGPGDSALTQLFDFEDVNVTINGTVNTKLIFGTNETSYSTVSKLVCDGEEWLCIDGDEGAIYFDGEKTFFNGIEDDSKQGQKEMFLFDITDMEYYIDSLIELDGVFVSEGSISGISPGEKISDVTIITDDGRLISVEYTSTMTGEYGGENYTSIYKYNYSFEWDNSSIDGDKYNKPSEWAKKFVIENATITKNTLAYGSVIDTSSLKIDGDEWLVVDSSSTTYCDGVNVYVDGVLDSFNINEKEFFLNNITYIANGESYFTERQDVSGEFTASSVPCDFGTMLDVVVTIENDKVVSVVYNDGYYDYKFTFTDYGTTEINGDDYISVSDWQNIFNLTNVTVKETFTLTDEEGDSFKIADAYTEFKIDGQNWSAEDFTESSPGVAEKDYSVIYNNGQCSVNGELTTEVPTSFIERVTNLLSNLKLYEEQFSFSMDGVVKTYTASELSMYDFVIYKDVIVTVEDGVLTSIVYTSSSQIEVAGQLLTTTFTYVFYNHGTTTVPEITGN